MKNELEIFEDGDGQRIVLPGPEVMISAHVSVSFAMAVHELTTNALKYGALSVLGGVLSVTRSFGDTRLMMKWDECNVPISEQTARVGFSSQLLQRLLPQQLGTSLDMKFAREGLKVAISIDMGDAFLHGLVPSTARLVSTVERFARRHPCRRAGWIAPGAVPFS